MRKRRGSAIVEATLIHMLLLTFLFSIFDFGYVMFMHQTIMHQVRTAARYGAVHPGDLTAVQNMVLYNRPSAPQGNPPGVFGLQPSMVNVTRSGEGTSEDRVNIVVSGYHFIFVTPGVAGRFMGKPIEVALPVEGE